MAYLGATPKGQTVSRLEALKQISLSDGSDEAPTNVDMPEIDPSFGHLLELFFLSGQAISTGMGLVSITWSEMESFLRVNSLDLTLWEIETIKAMSDAYCAEYARASEPNRPAPYQQVFETDEELIQKNIAQAVSWRSTIRSIGKK